MTILLIDGDTFVYRHAAGATQHVDWGDGQWCAFANEHEATFALKQEIKELQTTLEADKVLIALSHPLNFRRDLEPSYKQNRKQREPLLLYKALRKSLEQSFPTHTWARLEADDVLGILATAPAIEEERIIISIDKDLKQVPGKHYNPDHPEAGIVEITAGAADYAFYRQVLTGDSIDGYSGCPGIGEKRARVYLEGATEQKAYWQKIVTVYRENGFDEAYALTQARLARLLRHGEYCQVKGPCLWNPD